MAATRFFLVVVGGLNAGRRLLLDEHRRLVGRGVDADLHLDDRFASRRHLLVAVVGERVEVELCPGAAKFVVAGRAVQSAQLYAGGQILVGNTVLAIAEASTDGARSSTPDAASMDTRTLFTGFAADVRAFAAVLELGDALDAAATEGAVEEALAAWARGHIEAVGTSLITENSDSAADTRTLQDRPSSLHEQSTHDGKATVVTVPAHGASLIWIKFTFAVTPDRISDSLRRVLFIAGRLCASRFGQLRAVHQLRKENESFRQLAVGSARGFLGDSPEAAKVVKVIPRLAATDFVVLLEGETGTGKTFLARLLHESGPRSAEPFRVINCAAIPKELLESELFGHERGAFTGAVSAHAGAFEAAGGGTVLLDEVGELPLPQQGKLLRVLEDKRYERVGSNRARSLRARIIAATNRDLAAMVASGAFREDLYHRLAVITLRVPPLRDRGDDLVVLARAILADLTPSAGRRIEGFSTEALQAMRAYRWPGNVRELRNAIERAIALGDQSQITPSDLPETIGGGAMTGRAGAEPFSVRLPAALDVLEARAIEAALRVAGGHRGEAARLLGITKGVLYYRLKTHAAAGRRVGEFEISNDDPSEV